MVDAEKAGYDGRDAQAGEDGAGLLQGECVDGCEDVGERGEGEVQDEPAKRDPEGEEEYNGLRGEEVKGTEERDTDHEQ